MAEYRKRRARIGDVARLAGVSVSTVSNVMNGRGRVAKSTCERVLEAADRLDYSPSVAARKLRGGTSGLVAVARAQGERPEHVFGDYSPMLDHLTAAAAAREYSVVFVPSADDSAVWQRIHIDGAVVLDPSPVDAVLTALARERVPVVSIGRQRASDEPDYWVDNDTQAAVKAALDYLAAAGARRVVLLADKPNYAFSSDIASAYLEWCADRGMLRQTVDLTEATEEEGFKIGASLLVAPSPPDAILAMPASVAAGVLLAARMKGVRVPDDLMVMTASHTESANSTSPSLSTLNLDVAELAQRAVTMLVTLMTGETPPLPHEIVPARLIARESTRNG
jgi:DNA-binding LacI/PurR family transcriptional regulator